MGTITLVVRRSEGKGPSRIERYALDVEPTDTVLSLLEHARVSVAPGLAFRAACRQGMCGECAVRVDGQGVLACITRVAAVIGRSSELHVEPLRGFLVERDLIVDRAPFFEAYESARPWLVPRANGPIRENLVTPDAAQASEGAEECVLCGICNSTCPVTSSLGAFPGPAALLKCFSRVVDERDAATEERLAWAQNNDRAFRCHGAFACMDACPKGLDPAQAIMRLRRKKTSPP